MAGTPADPGWSEEVLGDVHGWARLESGDPVANGRLVPVPQSAPAVSIEEIGYLTKLDGFFRLSLPAETYTIRVFADSPSGAPLYGEVTGVVITAGQETLADILVT
jgi:hypothetical protein